MHQLYLQKNLKNLKTSASFISTATIGLIASIVTALLLPGKIYEYITTAAGILILFNWAFIIISALYFKMKMGEDAGYYRFVPYSGCSKRHINGKKYPYGFFC